MLLGASAAASPLSGQKRDRPDAEEVKPSQDSLDDAWATPTHRQEILDPELDANSTPLRDALAKQQAILEAATQEMAATMSNMQHKFLEQVSDMSKVLEPLRKQIDLQQQITDNRLDSHDSRLSVLESARQDESRQTDFLRKQIQKLTAEVAAASAPRASTTPASAEWHRDADSSILRIRATTATNKTAILDSLAPLLKSAKLEPDEFRLDGDDVGASFTLCLHGTPELAARRAARVHSAQRISDSTWRDIYASLPNGDTTRIYIDFDKSKAQIFLEKAGKKFKPILASIIPGGTFTLRRRDLALYESWAPIAKLESPGPGEIIVRWSSTHQHVATLRENHAEKQLQQIMLDPVASTTWV